MELSLLDGPMGTELIRLGHPCTGPSWSAEPLLTAPEAVAAIHAAYARAGATLHTANTFRTQPHILGDGWIQSAKAAVALARGAVPAGHRVLGSMAPIGDCYRPNESPDRPGPQHEPLAQVLAEAGVDIILVETFPHPGEALAAARAALATGVPTWLSLTAGPNADLMSPTRLQRAAEQAGKAGVAVVLVNCIAASLIDPYVAALAEVGLPFGVYANAGDIAHGMGWGRGGAKEYAERAERWVERGASVVGGCCGTDPSHVAELRRALFE